VKLALAEKTLDTLENERHGADTEMSKIEYRTLNDRAYDEIKKGLIAGQFSLGQPLVIRTLAETYGISATPVREALQRLVAERLLEMLPNRSIVVPELSTQRFIELARIRSALEGLAAELATRNFKAEHMEELQSLLASIAETMDRRDTKTYVLLNQKFHFCIYERADSPHLLQLIQDLWVQVGPFFNDLFDDENFILHANDQHVKIVNALARGDAQSVREFIIRDITIAADSLLPHLSSAPARKAS
jgi:DNA-binding GntR family transcriptional regulator